MTLIGCPFFHCNYCNYCNWVLDYNLLNIKKLDLFSNPYLDYGSTFSIN